MSGSSRARIEDLPPELLEEIFAHLASDLRTLKNVSEACPTFDRVIQNAQLKLKVVLPLTPDLVAWVAQLKSTVHTLVNKEVAVYILDQVCPLNFTYLKVAKLVSFDYQTRRCEVSPHYVRLLKILGRQASHSLSRLDLNVDLSPSGRGSFLFVDLIVAFPRLEGLAIHFSGQIELNERILHSDHSLRLVRQLLDRLHRLQVLHLYTFPWNRLSLASSSLVELGLFKSDLTEISQLNTPALRKLYIQEDFRKLVLGNFTHSPTDNRYLHRNLFSVLYKGCPRLEYINHQRFPAMVDAKGHSLTKEEWLQIIQRASSSLLT